MNLCIKKISILYVTLIFCALTAGLAHAQSGESPPLGVEILPATSLHGLHKDIMNGEETHPALHMSPEKSELVRLDADAASVIVGNSHHINVIADSPRTLVVIPRTPGASHFIVLGKNGDVVMRRHVVVTGTQNNYVRVRKACRADDKGCRPTNVYYCPDACHEVQLPEDDDNASAVASYTFGASDGPTENKKSHTYADPDNDPSLKQDLKNVLEIIQNEEKDNSDLEETEEAE